MWIKISLRTRLLTPVIALAVLTISGGLFSLWHNYRVNQHLETVVAQTLSAMKAADRLETSLVMQKGYLTYFFQDGDETWLKDLETHHHAFLDWMTTARQWAQTPRERQFLNQIEADYVRLVTLREQVIGLYKAGKREEGFQRHMAARKEFFDIYDSTQKFREAFEKQLFASRLDLERRASQAARLTLAGVSISLFLSLLASFILISQVLRPIRLLALQASGSATTGVGENEVKELSRGINTLLKDMDQTKSELEVSRNRLLAATKMASVGKLAASVAHTIRNPLTSVKMRLFSLARSLNLSERQQEDFSVIEDEIRHIDNVLRNFLEFSRRPRLKVQKISPSEVVDMAVDLVIPRLESYTIDLEINRSQTLPQLEADPDQLKEALVNLLVNASEALGHGGRITIEEKTENCRHLGWAVVIRVKDTGPGIPTEVRDQVFSLFFSTKDEGTGLGLSIASRIVEEHGGVLELEDSDGTGAVFAIKLPV